MWNKTKDAAETSSTELSKKFIENYFKEQLDCQWTFDKDTGQYILYTEEINIWWTTEWF